MCDPNQALIASVAVGLAHPQSSISTQSPHYDQQQSSEAKADDDEFAALGPPKALPPQHLAETAVAPESSSLVPVSQELDPLAGSASVLSELSRSSVAARYCVFPPCRYYG